MKTYYNYGGFLETKVLEYEIDNNDLQILSYISMIQASDKMEMLKHNDDYYVWIKVEKIVEDNPRLRIKKRALETRISFLVEKGLIKKIVKCNENNIKKTYYRTTNKYRKMLFTEFEWVEEEKSKEEEQKPLKNEISIIDDRVDFEKFWKKYPRKIGKSKCLDWFNKHKPTNEVFEKMLETIDNFVSFGDWKDTDIKYIPHPLTWLNRGGWEDEITISKSNKENIIMNSINMDERWFK